MAQGSAGEVIKENGSLRGKKKTHNGFHFLIGNKSLGVTHTSTDTHRYTNTQPHRHAAKLNNTHTHNKGSERNSNLLAATICCDQSNNAICSCCWTGHHIEAVTGCLRPNQKWKQQEINKIASNPHVFGVTDWAQT